MIAPAMNDLLTTTALADLPIASSAGGKATIVVAMSGGVDSSTVAALLAASEIGRAHV